MKRQHFLIAMAITIIAVSLLAGAGIALIHLTTPTAIEPCTPAIQLDLALRFKWDAFVLGLLGAGYAVTLYYLMLRYQVFFPGLDIKRIAAATGGGAILALLLTVIDLAYSPQCLRTAIGPGSAIADELPCIYWTFSCLVVNAWLAIFLDQVLLAFAFTGMATFWRRVSLRGGI